MHTHPGITLRHLAGAPDRPLLVVGPSLGTTVDRLWGPVADRLEGWNVVGWDLPGHGHSPASDRRTPEPAMADLAAAVLATVDEAFGAESTFAYAGVSVGGAVGQQLALDAPTRTSSVVVLCSAAKFGTAEVWRERAALVRDQGMAPMVASSPARWFGTAIQGDGGGRIAAALSDLAAVDPNSYARVCEALASFDLRDRLGPITAPVLGIAGADDVATPPAIVGEITDGVPDGRLEVLPGVGHLAPYEDPDGVAALLAGFLALPASA